MLHPHLHMHYNCRTPRIAPVKTKLPVYEERSGYTLRSKLAPPLFDVAQILQQQRLRLYHEEYKPKGV